LNKILVIELGAVIVELDLKRRESIVSGRNSKNWPRNSSSKAEQNLRKSANVRVNGRFTRVN
jgi:hypothetical protein